MPESGPQVAAATQAGPGPQQRMCRSRMAFEVFESVSLLSCRGCGLIACEDRCDVESSLRALCLRVNVFVCLHGAELSGKLSV